MGKLVGPLQLAEAELLLQAMARRRQHRVLEDPMAPLMAKLEQMAERHAQFTGPQPPDSQCSKAELTIRKALLFGEVGSPAFRQVVRAELHGYVEAMRTERSA